MRRIPPRLIPLLLAAGSIIVALFAVELYFRVLYYGRLQFVVSATPGLIYEQRAGGGYYNEIGFRGPVYAGAPPPRTCRIAVLGDSVAFAAGLPDESRGFVRRFENSLNQTANRAGPLARYEVLNAAVQGYNLEQIAANYHYKVAPFNPHVVLYAFFYNDFDRPYGLQVQQRDHELVYAMMPNAYQDWQPPLPEGLDYFFSWYWRTYLFFRTRGYAKYGLPRIAQEEDTPAFQQYRGEVTRWLFRSLVTDVRRVHNRSLVLATIPLHAVSRGLKDCDRRVIYEEFGACSKALKQVELAKTLAAELAVPAIDLTTAYMDTRGADYRIDRTADDWSHPNEAGHQRLAEYLLRGWRVRELDRLCLAQMRLPAAAKAP